MLYVKSCARLRYVTEDVVDQLPVDAWEERETPCGGAAKLALEMSGWKVASQDLPSHRPQSSSLGKMPLSVFLCRRRFRFFCPEWTVSSLRWPFPATCHTFVPSNLCTFCYLYQNSTLPLQFSLHLLRCLYRMSTLWNLPQLSPDLGENPSAIFPPALLVHFSMVGWTFLRSNYCRLFFRGPDHISFITSGSHLIPWRMWLYMLAGLLADWLNKEFLLYSVWSNICNNMKGGMRCNLKVSSDLFWPFPWSYTQSTF